MRFRKFVLAFSLLQVCFMLAVQYAKADTITIDDRNPDHTVTVTGTANTTVTPLGCNEINGTDPSGACVFTFSRPGSGLTADIASFPQTFSLSEPGTPTCTQRNPATGCESDTLDTSLVGGNPQLTFNSDRLSAAGSEVSLGPCPTTGCTFAEDGNSHFAGIILWKNAAGSIVDTDTVSVWSDLAENAPPPVPEPASLILFGSGLAMAGGFLRRRRKGGVTPSVVA